MSLTAAVLACWGVRATGQQQQRRGGRAARLRKRSCSVLLWLLGVRTTEQPAASGQASRRPRRMRTSGAEGFEVMIFNASFASGAEDVEKLFLDASFRTATAAYG